MGELPPPPPPLIAEQQQVSRWTYLTNGERIGIGTPSGEREAFARVLTLIEFHRLARCLRADSGGHKAAVQLPYAIPEGASLLALLLLLVSLLVAVVVVVRELASRAH